MAMWISNGLVRKNLHNHGWFNLNPIQFELCSTHHTALRRLDCAGHMLPLFLWFHLTAAEQLYLKTTGRGRGCCSRPGFSWTAKQRRCIDEIIDQCHGTTPGTQIASQSPCRTMHCGKRLGRFRLTRPDIQCASRAISAWVEMPSLSSQVNLPRKVFRARLSPRKPFSSVRWRRVQTLPPPSASTR